jgi:ParB/RepB/Spo0J family partition protein
MQRNGEERNLPRVQEETVEQDARDMENAITEAEQEAEAGAIEDDQFVEATQGELAGLIPSEIPEGLATDYAPIDKLRLDPIGDPPTKGFINNVRLLGIIEPLVVRLDAEGFYEIIEGRRRAEAARILGMRFVPVVVETRSSANDLVLALAANYQRSPNFIGDARNVVRLLEHSSEHQVAAATGMAIPQVRAARDMITRLHPKLVEAAETGHMAKWASTHAARLPMPAQERLLADLQERLQHDPKAKITDQHVIEARNAGRDVAKATLPASMFDREGGDAVDPVLYGDATAEDLEEEFAEGLTAVAEQARSELATHPDNGAKPTKISREDRVANAVSLLQQARKELMAIKGRSEDQQQVVIFIDDELLPRLLQPVS